jgi:hypothetical protein
MKEQLDTLQVTDTGVVASGSMAQRLLDNGFKVNSLRPACTDAKGNALKNNATLRYDEWKEYDRVLVEETVRPMRAVAALRAAGLTYGIGNGFAKPILQYEDVSKMGEATLSMDGESERDNDRVEFTLKYLPLPILAKSWFINGRVLASSRETGAALDTTQTAQSGTRIGELLEDLTLNGSSSFTFGGGTIYGLTDHPQRNTLAMAVDWGSASPAAIVKDVKDMVQKCFDDFFYGPFILFVSANCEMHWNDDYSSHYAKTILNRVKEISTISDVVFCPFLNKSYAYSQGVLVQRSPGTVRIVEGMPLTNVQWEERGNTRFHFKGMTIAVPQVRATQAGNSGICHCKAGL